MEQLDIFTVETENGLTTRQWRLHDLFMSHPGKVLDRYQILVLMDNYYGYTLERARHPKRERNNLSCLRELAADIEAVKWDATIQHIFVGGKYANSRKEAAIFIKKTHIKGLTELKYESVCKAKLTLDGQQRLVFNQEADHWESLLKFAKIELAEMEKEKANENENHG